MIYITTGTFHLGFNRLIKSLDSDKNLTKLNLIAQIGGGSYKPKNFKYFDYCTPKKQNILISKSKIVITHGGIASVLRLINAKKKFIVVPKNINEHPNDQLSAMRYFKYKYKINVIYNLKNIYGKIYELQNSKNVNNINLPKSNVSQLISNFINKIDYCG